MPTLSLRSFLQSGELDPIRLGMTRAAVAEVLGPPEATGGGSRKWRTPTIWKYGDLELYYEIGKDHLVTILMDSFTIPSGGSTLAMDPWLLRGEMSLEAAKAALTSEGIAYTEQPWRGEPGGRVLVTRGGVHLGFILEPEEYGPPAGLWYIARAAG